MSIDKARASLDSQWNKHIGGLFGCEGEITEAVEALIDAKLAERDTPKGGGAVLLDPTTLNRLTRAAPAGHPHGGGMPPYPFQTPEIPHAFGVLSGIPAPADMRKPEDGGTREAYSYAVSLFSHLAPQCEPLPDLIGVLTQIDNATTIIPTLRATIAERDRRIEELEAATKAAIRAAELALFVIRKQGVMPNASWERGFDVDLATARALLSGQQDTGDTHG